MEFKGDPCGHSHGAFSIMVFREAVGTSCISLVYEIPGSYAFSVFRHSDPAAKLDHVLIQNTVRWRLVSAGKGR